ncbi:hypothetical protein Tco_0709895 [Tanacetum coccineum]
MCRKLWLPKKEDDAPPEGEKGAKRQKTLKSSKYARDSSVKQPATHDPYCIVDRPNTSLIYLNNKEEKMVAEIVKFYDATNKQAFKAPCADENIGIVREWKTNSTRNAVMMEPDINNMMLNEYLMHKGRHRDLAKNYTSTKSVAPVRNRFLIYLDYDEEDEESCSLPPLLLCFHTPQPCTKFNFISHNVENAIDFDSITLADYDLYMAMQSSMESDIRRISALKKSWMTCLEIGGENLRSMEHEEVENRCDEETEEENIIVSTTEGLEEVKVEDVEMDENHNVDHSNTKKDATARIWKFVIVLACS